MKYNNIEERRNGTKGGSGRVTTQGRLTPLPFDLYTHESRDGLMRHDHVIRVKHSRNAYAK